MGHARLANVAASTALVLLVGVYPLNGQRVTGRVVEDGSDQRVGFAHVALVGADGITLRSTMADSAGYFILDARPGTYRLRASQLGYSLSTTNEITLQAGETVTVLVRLAARGIPLAPLEVRARGGEERGRDGFARRCALGKGVCLTVDSIRLREPRAVTDIFDGIPGVVVWDNGTRPIIYSMTGGNCLVAYFDYHLKPLPTFSQKPAFESLRGNLLSDSRSPGHIDINTLLTVDWVQGVEIYRNLSEVPQELRTAWRMADLWPVRIPGQFLGRRATVEACGMVWIWTRNNW